jgi:hypothetical protein
VLPIENSAQKLQIAFSKFHGLQASTQAFMHVEREMAFNRQCMAMKTPGARQVKAFCLFLPAFFGNRPYVMSIKCPHSNYSLFSQCRSNGKP